MLMIGPVPPIRRRITAVITATTAAGGKPLQRNHSALHLRRAGGAEQPAVHEGGRHHVK